MDLASAKMIGAGLACIALVGAGIGIGNVFAALISSLARNPAAQAQVQPFAFLGFALAEATGLFDELGTAWLLLDAELLPWSAKAEQLLRDQYAAVGAASSNEQDAQQLQLPVTMPLVFGFVMYNAVLRDPNSTLSIVMSEIPFFSPILMVLRITAQTPPFWQIALSISILAATSLGVVYLSSRIYRVGILMYGKRPSVVEILRWLRYT